MTNKLIVIEIWKNTISSIYLSWPVGLVDHYYWISEVFLGTGIVNTSKWYYRNSDSRINNRKFKIFFISEQHIFWEENYSIPSIYKNLIIIDRSSFVPLKVVETLYLQSYFGFLLDINSFLYVVFAKEDFYIRRIIFDEDLNFTSDTKIFKNCENVITPGRMKMFSKNDSIIFGNTNTYVDVFNTTSIQTSIHKMSFDFNSGSWESIIPAINQTYDSYFKENQNSALIQLSDKNVSYSYIKSKISLSDYLLKKYVYKSCI